MRLNAKPTDTLKHCALRLPRHLKVSCTRLNFLVVVSTYRVTFYFVLVPTPEPTTVEGWKKLYEAQLAVFAAERLKWVADANALEATLRGAQDRLQQLRRVLGAKDSEATTLEVQVCKQ